MKLKNVLIATVLMGLATVAITASAQLPEHIKVPVTRNGETYEFSLSKHSIRSSDFLVRSWDSTNGYVEESVPVRTYRGYVTENPNELVIAYIKTNDRLDATVFNGSRQIWSANNIDVSGLLAGGPPPERPTTAVPRIAGSRRTAPTGRVRCSRCSSRATRPAVT